MFPFLRELGSYIEGYIPPKCMDDKTKNNTSFLQDCIHSSEKASWCLVQGADESECLLSRRSMSSFGLSGFYTGQYTGALKSMLVNVQF